MCRTWDAKIDAFTRTLVRPATYYDLKYVTLRLILRFADPMQIRFYRLQNTKRRMHKRRKLGELQLLCPAADI